MAENSRMSKLSSKDDECVFSWKLFTGWDFMIGRSEGSTFIIVERRVTIEPINFCRPCRNCSQSYSVSCARIQGGSAGGSRKEKGQKKVRGCSQINDEKKGRREQSTLNFFSCFSWKVIALRITVNIVVIHLLGVSAFAVVWVVNR